MAAVFAFPTTILFGAETIDELPARMAALGMNRPLLVSDRGLTATAAFQNVRKILDARDHLFVDVQANPTDENVAAAVDAFRAAECDSVIGLGGGSALDVAKVIRLQLAFPETALAELKWDMPVDRLVPFIAIPTTAGTGSEVGRSSVITFGSTKKVIFHPKLLADLVILDPNLTLDLPPKLTAATGADALTHCIESFTSPEFHPLCEAIALEGIRITSQALPRAVATPRDVDARGKMQIAAMMGGIAFQKDLGAAHSLAHPLSALCGIHHGTANALVLPAVMRFNAARKPGVYSRIGQALGLRDSSDAAVISRIEGLLKEVGLTPGLRAAGVKDSQFDALADQAIADGCHKTNSVPVTRADLLALYKQAM